MLIPLALAVLTGSLLPVQSGVNARLARHLGAPLAASLVSFGVGLVALAAMTLATGTSVPWSSTAADQPWWIWLGGLCGLVFLTVNLLLMPRLGASATVALPVLGQVVGGLAVDAAGAFGVTRHPATPLRSLGVLAVATGALLVTWRARSAGAARTPPAATAVLWAAGFAGGALAAVQAAVNGRLGSVMGSALAAALVSFAVGTVGLVVVNAAAAARARPHRPVGAPPWSLTGGLLGAFFVLVVAWVTPQVGTSLAVSASLFGQLLGGLLLDRHGAFGAPPRPVTPRRLAGAALVLAGVLVVRFAT